MPTTALRRPPPLGSGPTSGSRTSSKTQTGVNSKVNPTSRALPTSGSMDEDEDTRSFFKRQFAKFEADKVDASYQNEAMNSIAKAAVGRKFGSGTGANRVDLDAKHNPAITGGNGSLSTTAGGSGSNIAEGKHGLSAADLANLNMRLNVQGGPGGAAAAGAAGEDEDDGMYKAPDFTSDLWKKFGCDTEAGRALRMLYYKDIAGARSKHYTQNVDASIRSTNSSRFDPKRINAEKKDLLKQKKCPQRDGQVPVPKVGQEKRKERMRELEQLRLENARPGIKTKAMIEAEEHEHLRVNHGGSRLKQAASGMGPRGRDNNALKERLANKFTYGEAFMEPVELRRRRQERELDEANFLLENDGLTRGEVDMAVEIEAGIKEKETKLAEIDERTSAVHPNNRSEWKRRMEDDKEALQLETELQRDRDDLKKFLTLVGK